MRILLSLMILGALSLHAQALSRVLLEGIWQGYDGEWRHVSNQLVALAAAIPAEKYAWRPAPGVRSTSEVFMHIAVANFYLLSLTGPASTLKMPAELTATPDSERIATAKPEVMTWLKRSLDAVKSARANLKPHRPPAQSERAGPGCHCGWHVSSHHRACQRAHGAIDRLRSRQWDCATLVGSRAKVSPLRP
jgi:hypothetical protein